MREHSIWRAIGLLSFLLPLTTIACFGRNPSDLKSLPTSEARFVVRAPCSPAKANAAVAAAGGNMELEVNEAGSEPDKPWLLTRGRRLAEPILLFRVDVAPVPEHTDASEIRVFVLPVSTQIIVRGRRKEQLEVALQQTRIDDESPFVTRPISWSTGRGFLVVRKLDGAFREIVTGPPDIYEEPFRAASVGAVVASKMVLTFAEGVDASKWQDRNEEESEMRLVRRSLLGYAVDESSLVPATEYEKRSVVPLASY